MIAILINRVKIILNIYFEIRRYNKINLLIIIMQFRTIDLFAGIGWVRIWFENAWFTTVYANDFDIPCKTTYDLNFESVKLDNKDINDIDIESLPEFDFLLWWFPCQPFSVAWYRKWFWDDRWRWNLFFKVAEIIEKRKPLWVFLENVKNLEWHDKWRTFKVIKDTLENLWYFVKHKVLNSAIHWWIPQNRERIFIVWFKKKNTMINLNFLVRYLLIHQFLIAWWKM